MLRASSFLDDIHILADRTLRVVLLLVQALRLNLAPEKIPVKEVRYLAKAIRSMDVRGHGEDLVEFFERLAFGFLFDRLASSFTDYTERY